MTHEATTPEEAHRLALEYLPMAEKIARAIGRRAFRAQLDADDLVQEGYLALYSAAMECNSPETFPVYARFRVRQHFANVRPYTGYAVGMTYMRLKGTSPGGKVTLSGEVEVFKDMPDASRPAERDFEMVDARDTITERLAVLTPYERSVVERFFGLGCPEESVREIAATRGVVRASVAQSLKRAIRRMAPDPDAVPRMHHPTRPAKNTGRNKKWRRARAAAAAALHSAGA